MSELAIRIEHLGKEYRIGGKQQHYKTLRESVTATFSKSLGRLSGSSSRKTGDERFWALQDVSFEVKHGEVLGVIGRNGAGKSTLLKILSRITEPTAGYADVYGRVGSLLEVGTGFHPELTGRENIFLNGTILGMGHQEIERKFDEIVAFAEVDRFVDTPVKHFSSGMYLRLAFAVAAHLEPEILLVDEVLAVGDAAFQKKCLGKLGDVAQQGRTVLFVSHNMAAVQSLCSRSVVLGAGKVEFIGNVDEAMQHYQASLSTTMDQIPRPGALVHFGGFEVNQTETNLIDATKEFEIGMTMTLGKDLPGYSLFCILSSTENDVVLQARVDSKTIFEETTRGRYQVRIQFPVLWLKPGLYAVQFKLSALTINTKGVVLSEPQMVQVTGNTEAGSMRGLLTPDITWMVTR